MGPAERLLLPETSVRRSGVTYESEHEGGQLCLLHG